ncbi:MAG: hypothetical protein IKN34_02150, partial [Treponema sp.]|nr:hypothetical protein [Treponema sp.]
DYSTNIQKTITAKNSKDAAMYDMIKQGIDSLKINSVLLCNHRVVNRNIRIQIEKCHKKSSAKRKCKTNAHKKIPHLSKYGIFKNKNNNKTSRSYSENRI